MKNYQVEITVKIREGGEIYSPNYPINFKIDERLPANTDAQRHLRARLAEELKRNFDALIEPLENKTDEAKANEDPLESGLPF